MESKHWHPSPHRYTDPDRNIYAGYFQHAHEHAPAHCDDDCDTHTDEHASSAYPDASDVPLSGSQCKRDMDDGVG